MRKRLLAVSVLSVLLASCGGGSSDSGTTADVPGNAGDGSDAPSGEDNGDNPAEGDNGESPAAGDNGGTATGGDVLYTGEVVAANNCVLDTLSLTDSEYRCLSGCTEIHQLQGHQRQASGRRNHER